MTPSVFQEWTRGLGGRRFFAVIGAGVVDTILVWAGKITGDQYVTLTLGTIGVYIAAGTYQKVKGTAVDAEAS